MEPNTVEYVLIRLAPGVTAEQVESLDFLLRRLQGVADVMALAREAPAAAVIRTLMEGPEAQTGADDA